MHCLRSQQKWDHWNFLHLYSMLYHSHFLCRRLQFHFVLQHRPTVWFWLCSMCKAAICEARKPLRPEIKHEAFMQIGGKLEIAWQVQMNFPQAYSTKSASQFEQLRCFSGGDERWITSAVLFRCAWREEGDCVGEENEQWRQHEPAVQRRAESLQGKSIHRGHRSLGRGQKFTALLRCVEKQDRVKCDQVLRLNPEHIKALRSKALACRYPTFLAWTVIPEFFFSQLCFSPDAMEILFRV